MNEHSADSAWHIDRRCTNCDAARQFAPELIAEVDGRSSVIRQPRTDAEESALYAAAIDTPRWSDALAAKYAALGPITDVLLTHRDHAAHGRAYANRYGARLWIHEADLAAAPDADKVLRGTEPTQIAEGVTAHPLPGHTEGSVLYLADRTYCFSGDSLYWSRTTGDIAVVESVTWYSITELAASLARTAPRVHFEWLLPGHGDRKHLPAEEFGRRMHDVAGRTAQLPPQPIDFTAIHW
jgi:glyoxylase-like metal-dependent hydrolase (beta-lactamase superfamily II)